LSELRDGAIRKERVHARTYEIIETAVTPEIIIKRANRKNKALVLDAFDTLFDKRDYAAAEVLVTDYISTARTLNRVAMDYSI
jgi:hypothetical protein